MIQKRPAVDPDLYEADETAWLETMSELIDQGRLDELDYSHLGEYLTDMAKRDRREVKSRLVVLIKHVLKWTYQPEKRRGGWQTTILVQQRELQDLCGGGVLRAHGLAELAAAYSAAVKEAASETKLGRQVFPAECPYTLDQLLTMEVADT